MKFVDGIRNVIRWIPLIYRDRDWDYVYLMEIIKFKLENMEECFRKYGCTVDSKRKAKEMRICIKLLGRIAEDDYCEKEYDDHYEKWGRPEFKDHTIKCSKIITKDDELQSRKESNRLYEKEEKLKKQDMDLLFKIMRRKILGWWD